jgi:phosphotransferase system HPr (HPr) family protein
LTFHLWVAKEKGFLNKYTNRGNFKLIMGDAGDKCIREVVIVNDLGMHARSAAMIAQLALQAQSTIWFEKSGERADASSIIDLLSLGCSKGSKISVHVDNPKDCPILESIVKLIEDGFGE